MIITLKNAFKKILIRWNTIYADLTNTLGNITTPKHAESEYKGNKNSESKY